MKYMFALSVAPNGTVHVSYTHTHTYTLALAVNTSGIYTEVPDGLLD